MSFDVIGFSHGKEIAHFNKSSAPYMFEHLGMDLYQGDQKVVMTNLELKSLYYLLSSRTDFILIDEREFSFLDKCIDVEDDIEIIVC